MHAVPSFARVLVSLAAIGALLTGCPVTNNNRDSGGIDPRIDAPGRDAPSTPVTGLRIEPANHTIELGSTPTVVEYHAFFRAGDGTETDVTADCSWTSTAGLGTFAGATFTTEGVGGITTIRAARGADVATTLLTITGNQDILLPGVPPDAPTRFGGTVDASRAPVIVYPADHVMLPPNLGEIEFHYRQSGSELFELTFNAPTSRIRIYMNCPEAVGGGCAFVPEPAVWSALSAALAGAGEVTYRLRGVDAAGTVGESEVRRIRVAGEAITGGLYYWNAGGGSIDRFEFGLRGARAENFLNIGHIGAGPGGTCIGCHALSRNGTRIAAGAGPIPTSGVHVFDVATRNRLFTLPLATDPSPAPPIPSYFTFSPDASQMATSSTDGITIRNVADGRLLVAGLSGGGATMPDWSPDGMHIVYVRNTTPFPLPIDQPFITGGTIETLVFEGGGFVPGVTIANGGGNNYYPAYTPDGDWVSFNRSASNTANGDALDAELWVARADGSGGEVHLDAADFPGDSWAKWDPTEYLDRGSNIYWLSWSSTRGFGLRWADGGGQVQLWMAAFDESLAEAGMDPMSAAFRLPFQDRASGNHIAQWVTSIERLGCDDDTDCGGEFCVDGHCYEEPPGPF